MKLLRVRIPMTPPEVVVPEEDDSAIRRAALEELRALIPGLSKLKTTIPGIGTQAIGDQMYLTVTLVPSPQLPLNLSDVHWQLGRVVELDSTLVDQATVKASIQLTQDLIAAAESGEIEAIREYLEKFEVVERRRAANRLRRELARRYVISVLDRPEIVSLPEIAPTQLARDNRSFSLVVSQMRRRGRIFHGDHVEEIRADGHRDLGLDPRQAWTFRRLGAAQTFDAGQLLHESMEMGRRVIVSGRLVVHALTNLPIAMEVDAIGWPAHGFRT